MTQTTTPQMLKQRAIEVSPKKFAHIVCRTDQLQAMRDWYMKVLNATVAFENERLCFLRYDEEHHRIGFIDFGPLEPAPATPIRHIDHYSFTYQDLGELFGTYLRLKDLGIEPFWCINHGPTTSMYYRDPDGHKIELQVDNFTDEECDEFFASGAYEENPIGIIFEPDEWMERYASGESPRLLTKRPLLPAGVAASAMIRN